MQTETFEKMVAAVQALRADHPMGRVSGVSGGTVQVSGLGSFAAKGDRARIVSNGGRRAAEVVLLTGENLSMLVDGGTDGLRIGDRVILDPPGIFAPDDSWIGRVIDPDGLPLDGMPLLHGTLPRNVRADPPLPHQRRGLGMRIETGMAAFNTLLPLVQGQRVGLFAGSGVGKSTLLSNFARSADADVIVIALVGERGRELRHFVQDVLGPEGMRRAVVIAATSDRSPQMRRRCAQAATAVAEHFRDQGSHVLLLVDSITRFCEAHREIAVAGGELANLRGHPASAASQIAALCERAGPGAGTQGDITAIYTVLVAGSDMDEPIADMLRGVLDGHIVLDRTIAERGRFPAVDVLRSVSRSLPEAASAGENSLISQARSHLGVYDRASLMIQAGLYTEGSDAKTDSAIACQPGLERFLALMDGRATDGHFVQLRQILATGATRKPVEDRRTAVQTPKATSGGARA